MSDQDGWGPCTVKQWYAVHTKPRKEYEAERSIRDYGLEVYLPIIRRRRRRLGIVEEPFFPRYLFCRFELAQVDLHEFHWLRGVNKLVSFGGEPAVVPDQIVEFVREQVDKINARGGFPTGDIKPGDRVIIRDGPLAGFYAIFQGPSRPSERVWVLLELIGRYSKAQVHIDLLEKVESAPEERVKLRKRGTRGKGRRINYDK